MITKEEKETIIKKTQLHDGDTGSLESQVSILTARIQEITEHLKDNQHDFMAIRGLKQLVGRRKRFLKYLEENDYDSYKSIITKLGLRK